MFFPMLRLILEFPCLEAAFKIGTDLPFRLGAVFLDKLQFFISLVVMIYCSLNAKVLVYLLKIAIIVCETTQTVTTMWMMISLYQKHCILKIMTMASRIHFEVKQNCWL
jgi:hypothetical protein